MTRSLRKTPIFGMTNARSEKQDKKLWHKRMRTQERTSLASTSDLYAHIPMVERDVSNRWAMSKDGRQYFGLERQKSVAERVAQKGRTKKERASLKVRALKKWAGK